MSETREQVVRRLTGELGILLEETEKRTYLASSGAFASTMFGYVPYELTVKIWNRLIDAELEASRLRAELNK